MLTTSLLMLFKGKFTRYIVEHGKIVYLQHISERVQYEFLSEIF